MRCQRVECESWFVRSQEVDRERCGKASAWEVKDDGEKSRRLFRDDFKILEVECESWLSAVVGEVPTKQSSDHDLIIRHCQMIGSFRHTVRKSLSDDRFKILHLEVIMSLHRLNILS